MTEATAKQKVDGHAIFEALVECLRFKRGRLDQLATEGLMHMGPMVVPHSQAALLKLPQHI